MSINTINNDKCYTLPLENLNVNRYLNDSCLKFLNLNIRSIDKNIESLDIFLARLKCNIDIIALTETWEKMDKFNCQLKQYTRVNSSSQLNKSSGVSIFISSRINFRLSNDYKISCCDSLFIEVDDPVRGFLVFGVVYRSNAVDFNAFIVDWESLLECVVANKASLIVVGDFNINVKNLTCDKVERFVSLSNNYGFRQLVKYITRPAHFGGSIIDLCLSNCITETDTFVFQNLITDHYPVLTSFRDYFDSLQSKCAGRYFIKKVNWENFISDLQDCDFSDIINSNDIDNGIKLLVSKIKTSLSCNTEYISKNRRFFCPKKPWITNGILRSIRKREKMKFKLNKRPDLADLRARYIRYRNVLTGVIEKSKKTYFEQKIEKSVNSSKEMWNTVKGFCKAAPSSDNSPSEIKDDNGNTIRDPIEIADKFNNFFLNVGGADNLRVGFQHREFLTRLPNSIFLTPTTDSEILNIINSLKNKKTEGPDGISCFIIKKVKHSIIPSLVHLANIMLATGYFPISLKEARVRLVFKKGRRDNISNYRPISILNSISKIFEKVIYSRLENFIQRYNILSDQQFGFRTKRSAEDAIIVVSEFIKESINNNKYVAMVSLDIRKAFDSVNHSILLDKLNYIGIRGSALHLIKSYLENRFQFVQIEKYKSSNGLVLCGVPQGSILGPLLFNIYVNDVLNVKGIGEMTMYADDNTVYISGDILNNILVDLQNIMNNVVDWYEKNNLRLNLEKCKLIIFRSPYKDKYFFRILHSCVLLLNDFVLLPEMSVKYLGVILDCNLNWREQILHVCNKVCSTIPLFYKIRNVFSKSTLIIVFHAFCQSIIKYSILSYGNSHKSKFFRLLALQRKIVRIIFCKSRFENVDRLFEQNGLLDVYQLNIKSVLDLYNRSLLGHAYHTFCLLPRGNAHSYNIRNPFNEFIIPRFKNDYGRFLLKIRIPIAINFFYKNHGNIEFGKRNKRKFDSRLWEGVIKLKQRWKDIF